MRSQRKTNRMCLLEWPGWKRSVWTRLCWCCSAPPHIHPHKPRPDLAWMSHAAPTPRIQRHRGSWSQINVESTEQQWSTCSVSEESNNNDVFECVCDTALALNCQCFLHPPKALDGKHNASQNWEAAVGAFKVADPHLSQWVCINNAACKKYDKCTFMK